MEVTTKNGYTFQVDEEDYALASEPGWYGFTQKRIRVNGLPMKPYITIRRNTYKNKVQSTEIFARVILNAPIGVQVDHKNGNTLNCTRSNLRLCTHSQNQSNKDKTNNNSSGYKGIHWRKDTRKWRVRIRINRECKALGEFYFLSDAINAYNQGALRYFGEFARIIEAPNFPKV